MKKLKSFKEFEINQKSQEQVLGKSPKNLSGQNHDSDQEEDNDETEINVSISNLASFRLKKK